MKTSITLDPLVGRMCHIRRGQYRQQFIPTLRLIVNLLTNPIIAYNSTPIPPSSPQPDPYSNIHYDDHTYRIVQVLPELEWFWTWDTLCNIHCTQAEVCSKAWGWEWAAIHPELYSRDQKHQSRRIWQRIWCESRFIRSSHLSLRAVIGRLILFPTLCQSQLARFTL